MLSDNNDLFHIPGHETLNWTMVLSHNVLRDEVGYSRGEMGFTTCGTDQSLYSKDLNFELLT